MRTRNIALATAAICALSAVPAAAQSSASQTATGTTRIIQPITLSKTSDLAFGTVVRSSTASANTVSIDATTGARSITGSGDGVLFTSTTSRAAFTASGEGGQTFSISVPASFNMTSAGNTIAVTLTSTATSGTLSGSLGSTGTASFGVGGSYSVNNAQASGNYSGTFTATVAYN